MGGRNLKGKQERKLKIYGKFALKIVGVTAAVFILSFVVFYFTVKWGAFGKIPDSKTLKKIENNTATEVFSADSVLLGRFYLQERTHTKYKDISKNVINALIATEDARFFDHDGIDYRSLARVFFKTFLLLDRTSGGGSTISQQLVKNLYPRKDYGILSIPVSKVKEAVVAHRLENIYSKEEILSLYLNTVPFGDNVYGVEMAAARFFSKKARNLNLQEAAVLVGMLKANYYYNPRLYPENALSRRNVVLRQMEKYGYLAEGPSDSLSQLPLALNYNKITHNTGLATYFREHLRQELVRWCAAHEKPDGTPYNLYTDGLKVYTTIDSKLQKYAEKAMKVHMADLQIVFDKHWANSEPWGSNDDIVKMAVKGSGRYKNGKSKGLTDDEIMAVMKEPVPMKIFKWSGEEEVKLSPLDSIKHYLTFLQTGFLAMDARTGDIKAWVGGINHEYFKFDHVNLNTKRQVGSTFKPFVFAAALEKGIDPCDYISAEKITYTNLSNWAPENTDEDEYANKYSFKGALAKSVNTVSVRLMESVGIEKVMAIAKEAGIVSELPRVPSLALGTANISLLEMVTAYAVFANNGRAVTPRHLISITSSSGGILDIFNNERPKEQIISPENAMIMNSLLQAVVNEGTAGRYRWKYGMKNDLAGKTGTTQSNTDGWFIGYNPKMVVGSWVGGDNPQVRFRTTALGSGANTALPIVAKFFHNMQADGGFTAYSKAQFPQVPDYLMRRIDCVSEKEDKPFMEWLFGDKKGEKETAYEDEKEEKENIFGKIGNLFKKKK